jgi:SAM-dependent methyltransferase
MTSSVRFDRAAEFYDRTRAVDDAAMARTIELLANEVRGRGRVLQVGVGTGLLALPLHTTGVDVHGLDISAPMVAKLVEKAGGRVPFPIALGDATAMPFADGWFGAAYLRWVLHLIPDWRRVLAEVVRVVAPGGVFLANLGAYGGPRLEIQRRFGEITGVPTTPVGLAWGAQDELDAEMRRLGAAVRELEPVRQGGEETIRSFLDEIRDNLFSWTWRVGDDARLATVDELQPWAAERFGDLDAPRRWEHTTVWPAYDLA